MAGITSQGVPVQMIEHAECDQRIQWARIGRVLTDQSRVLDKKRHYIKLDTAVSGLQHENFEYPVAFDFLDVLAENDRSKLLCEIRIEAEREVDWDTGPAAVEPGVDGGSC
ncbi:hypothetical protein D3C71_819120 [compost metagenome]